MGREKAVPPNDGVMPDVIATPENNVILDFHEGLYGVVLEDEAVFPHFHIAPDKGAGTDVRRKPITLAFNSRGKPGTQAVQLGVDRCHVDLMGRGIVIFFDIFERNDRAAEQFCPLQEFALDRKSDDFVVGIRIEILAGDFRKRGITDDDQFFRLGHFMHAHGRMIRISSQE